MGSNLLPSVTLHSPFASFQFHVSCLIGNFATILSKLWNRGKNPVFQTQKKRLVELGVIKCTSTDIVLRR